jgi:hypothetical protein
VSLPPSFIEHLRSKGYHPRSDKHSNALAEALVEALVKHCEPISVEASAGRLVWKLNHVLKYGQTEWKTDLAIGLPPFDFKPSPDTYAGGMARGTPSTTRIAVEIKGVMTEHNKAKKNRKRDLEAHHQHVHNYERSAIAAAVYVINASNRFRSPLRKRGSVTVHKNPEKLVLGCLKEVNSITTATAISPEGLDAKAAIVLDMDNIALPTTHYVIDPPAPQIGDPIHWDSFIQRICTEYARRFP